MADTDTIIRHLRKHLDPATPHWRFKTPAHAKRTSSKICKMFRTSLDQNEFVGADMARKFLKMGYTRARRYAKYKGG